MMLFHRVFHPVCHGQWAGRCSVGRRAGVDLESLVEVMGAGSANSTMLELKGRPMLEHDFSPLFKLEHMLKDVGLCLDEARAAGAPFLPYFITVLPNETRG